MIDMDYWWLTADRPNAWDAAGPLERRLAVPHSAERYSAGTIPVLLPSVLHKNLAERRPNDGLRRASVTYRGFESHPLRQLVRCFCREISSPEFLAQNPRVSLTQLGANDLRERTLEITDAPWSSNSPFGSLAVRLGSGSKAAPMSAFRQSPEVDAHQVELRSTLKDTAQASGQKLTFGRSARMCTSSMSRHSDTAQETPDRRIVAIVALRQLHASNAPRVSKTSLRPVCSAESLPSLS
jgi:hypothetical protein